MWSTLYTQYIQNIYNSISVKMFINLWNLLLFPHVEEEEAMLEEDVVVGDALNVRIVREWATFKKIASPCTTFLTKIPMSLKLKLLTPNSFMKNTKSV